MPDRSPENLWETALGQLELQVTRPNFDTWLRHTRGLHFEDNAFVVGAQSDFAVEWLRQRMRPLVTHTLARILGTQVSVSFQVIGAAPANAADASGELESQPAIHTLSLAFDRRLTFEAFTTFDSNRLAQRAAAKVAAGASSYNPLVLAGEPGLGKSHLLHGIAHAAAATGQQVILLTGEEFVDRYGQAVRAGRPHTFRDNYRQCSLFLLDDLDFLASRPGSQEQFFHLFNTLHSTGRCVVTTATTLPTKLPGLSPHLRSRLQAGLTLELALPTAPERLLILQAKAANLRPLPTPVLELIAEQPYPSIREFEGALNRVAAFADLHSAPPTLESARQALSPFHTPPPPPTIDSILNAVLAHFHLSEDQLTSPSRARDIAYARHIAMYLLRQLAQRPLAEIGARLGNRDHSTVLSGYRRIARERDSLQTTQSDLAQIEAAIERSQG